MFCYQCEQTAKGTGCTVRGVCSKDHETATLQDLLLYAAKGIGMYAHRLHELGGSDHVINVFALEALFTTVTNVNFDPERLRKLILKAAQFRDKARELYENACKEAGKQADNPGGPAAFKPEGTPEGLIMKGEEIGIAKQKEEFGDEVAGLQNLILFGLKGVAAYADHAQLLGKEDENLYAFIHEALDFLAREVTNTDDLLGMALRVGEANLKAMELLDDANTSAYGHPVPTQVRVEPVKGKAILVSGHDLLDLYELLKQTEGKGINVYTHGEMLPAHGYPRLKEFKHLAGNFGASWQRQVKEFPDFPGPILMTTNCIQRPKDSYFKRIFTSGLVAWPGVVHIGNRDFSPLIEAALDGEGFTEDGPDRKITIGFAVSTVAGVLDKVVDAVKAGKIKHFFLIGGCDGAKPGRDYYTRFAEAVPQDSIILTLACGKYRFNKNEFGDIGGIPRLLDMGQCNDAYSAIEVAKALAEAFGCGVNDLPLTIVLSWYEQKAVAILLTLLHLGIKNMHIGPSLPAFVTPEVFAVLEEKFNVMPTANAEEDLTAILK